MASEPTIRPATLHDLERLHRLVESAYRGEAARAGWTHEADLIEGARTDLATLSAIIERDGDQLLMAEDADGPLGCVQITDKGGGVAYLGLLSVDPRLQAQGLGRLLMAAAEAAAARDYGARSVEMTVIDCRTELIAYYQRRGYALIGETRPFPIALDPPLSMVVLAKRLPRAG